MVFHHRERLMLTGQDQLQFGDVLRWKNPETGANTDTVSLVVTPACDLTRDGVENALLLCGTLKSLAPSEWSYGANETKTAIVIAGDDERFCIKWNLKKIHTHASTELKKWVSEGAKLERFARLRTTYAIELQQKLLTDLGRIGQPANPPGTFPVTLSLFYVDVEGNAQPLDIDADGQAVCYVGRDAESKPVHRLVLSEQLCDALQEAVKSLDENNVSQSARASLQAFKPDQAFFTRFERGEIEVPSTDGSFKPSKNENNLTYVCVSRNGDLAKDKNITGECRKAAILIKVIDVLGAVS
jgi:hypothetical protein